MSTPFPKAAPTLPEIVHPAVIDEFVEGAKTPEAL